MNNEKKDYQAAVLVHECLRARTDCFGNDGKIVKTAYIVCIDDDPDSAIHAVRLAKQHFAAHGFFPKMLCVGNKGLLSRWTHKTTEGCPLLLHQASVAPSATDAAKTGAGNQRPLVCH